MRVMEPPVRDSDFMVDVGRDFRLALMAAIGLFALLMFQLTRSMQIDSFGIEGGRLDILGYWVALAVSSALALRLWAYGKLRVLTMMLVLFLIAYIATIAAFTNIERSLIGLLVSRSGLLMWFIVGIGVGGMFDIFQTSRAHTSARATKVLVLAGFVALGGLTMRYAVTYAMLPVRTDAYQAIAANASILLIILTGAIEALWGGRKPVLVIIAYLTFGSVLTTAVVLTQATSIVAIWFGLVAIFFWRTFWDGQILTKLALILAVVGGITAFTQTEAYEDVIVNTRFSVFFGDTDAEFSPLASRLALLDTFSDQFAVSPVFGNFRAESLVGEGQGNYMHSLPLSFLTHTGIVGTTLFGLVLFGVMRGRVFFRSRIDPAERQFGRVMLMVLALGTIANFLTWNLLWFMLGVLCRRPAILPERD